MRERIPAKTSSSTFLRAQQDQRTKEEQAQHAQQSQPSQRDQAAALPGKVTTSIATPGRDEPRAVRGHSLSRLSILRPDGPTQATERPSLAGVPGNHVVQRAPVPQPAPAPTSTTLHQVARQASQLPVSPMPHAARIQRSFGHYSLAQIQAHQGAEATTSAQRIEAQAFTSGNHVVFAGIPSLQIAAHEAAHVIQQQNGIHLPGGIDTPGDRYERHAAAVAQRVVAGQSAEALLDQGIDTAHEPSPHVLATLHPAAIQRVVRAGLDNTETTKLTDPEKEEQNKVFTQDKGDAGPAVTATKPEAEQLFQALEIVANTYITNYNFERAPVTPSTGPSSKKLKVNSSSNYNAILNLAIKEAKKMYQVQLDEAYGETASDAKRFSSYLSAADHGGQPITRADPDDRFKNALADTQRIKNEAISSAEYMIDVSSVLDHQAVTTAFEAIVKHHQTIDNKVTEAGVEEAYLKYLADHGEKKLLEKLAEARLRYDPKTEASTIYLTALADTSSVKNAWNTYKVLVHEVMHTAAHRKFEEYVHEQGALSNTILEGTVDYFAHKVWQRIVQNLLGASPDATTISVVQEISNAKKKYSLSATAKGDLNSSQNELLYPDAVATIEEAIGKITDGERRLKAAFFYGDVEHFFPDTTI